MTVPTTPSHATREDGHETGLRAEALDFAGRFLLWAMRAWLVALRRDADRQDVGRRSSYRAIAGEGFRRADIPQATDLIDDIFSAIAVAALREVDLRCPHCAYVSPDEALLLGAVAASQRGRHGISWAALSRLLAPAAARAALPSLIALAVLLRDAGLTLEPLDAGTCGAPDLCIALAHGAATAPVH